MTQQAQASPQQRIFAILEQYWLGRTLAAAARLGIADTLVSGPRSAGEIARELKLHEPSLQRLLRALAGYGYLRIHDKDRFALTELGEALVSDRPGSMRDLLFTLIGAEHYTAWGELEQAVRAGGTAFDHHYGRDVWAYFRENPERGQEFNRTMVAATAAVNQAVMEAYDFSRFNHIVDVGGGHGSLLRLTLAQNPRARGTVFDQPNVIEDAKASASREPTAGGGNLADRISFVGGSFFESVPEGADCYLLKYILHDWDDARCETILKNVRRAIAPGGTLLVFDTVIPPMGTQDFSLLMDLNMLVMTGGRERSEPELRELLGRCGFRLTRVLPTKSHISITEAAPA